MSAMSPEVRMTGALATVNGRFFRLVSTSHRHDALLGSVKAGRYSRPDQPTLYLSASQAGVDAAMISHPGNEKDRTVLAFAVSAAKVFDLRSRPALDRVRAEAGDPLADWQDIVVRGGEPSSWRARDWIESIGATGLIDPSRKAPGLWHLVLFRWNVDGGSSVTLQSAARG